MQPSSTNDVATFNPLQDQLQRLQERLKKQRNQGSIILGRWFQERGVTLKAELQARMTDSLKETLKRPRDKRLFGLPVEEGRSLRSEKASLELSRVQSEIERLQKRADELQREEREAQRKEKDARLLLQGEAVRRWREKDADFAKLLTDDLGSYLRHPNEFIAVELPVPAHLKSATAAGDGGAPEGSAKEEGTEKDLAQAVPSRLAGPASGPAEALTKKTGTDKNAAPQNQVDVTPLVPPAKTAEVLPSIPAPKFAGLPSAAPASSKPAAVPPPRVALPVKPASAAVPASSGEGG